jgi:hypothetical protein
MGRVWRGRWQISRADFLLGRDAGHAWWKMSRVILTNILNWELIMSNFTDDPLSVCENKAVNAIDYFDPRILRKAHVSLDDNLQSCDHGPQKCRILADWINKHRAYDGKPPIEPSSITPETTIREVISHVC